MADWRVVQNDFGAIHEQFRSLASDIIGQAAFMCEDHVKSPPPEGAPVDTGTLSGSASADHTPGSMRSTCDVSAEYAGFVNFGTVYQDANPFFDRAVAHAVDWATKELANMGGKLG